MNPQKIVVHKRGGLSREGVEGCAGGLKVLGRKRDKDGKGGISERAVG